MIQSSGRSTCLPSDCRLPLDIARTLKQQHPTARANLAPTNLALCQLITNCQLRTQSWLAGAAANSSRVCYSEASLRNSSARSLHCYRSAVGSPYQSIPRSQMKALTRVCARSEERTRHADRSDSVRRDHDRRQDL